MENSYSVKLTGQKIEMVIEGFLDDKNYWDVTADSNLSIRGEETDWVSKAFQARVIDTDIDMAMSRAMVSIMEQLNEINISEHFDKLLSQNLTQDEQ